MNQLEILKEMRKSFSPPDVLICLLDKMKPTRYGGYISDSCYGLVSRLPVRDGQFVCVTLPPPTESNLLGFKMSDCKLFSSSKIQNVWIPADGDFVEFQTRNSFYRLTILAE